MYMLCLCARMCMCQISHLPFAIFSSAVRPPGAACTHVAPDFAFTTDVIVQKNILSTSGLCRLGVYLDCYLLLLPPYLSTRTLYI